MENFAPTLIDAIFAHHQINDNWHTLPATGIANHIFATEQVVLRIATDHAEAICDARTESIAAPVAHAAGILTPRLLVFDDSCSLIDRPYSLWQRVHGETLGLIALTNQQSTNLSQQIGAQLWQLHSRVTVCPDPFGYLDLPARELDLYPLIAQLQASKRIDHIIARAITALIDELARYITTNVTPRFIHNDIHSLNIMCTASGELLAIIDWGDAGWGDPTLEFVNIPLDAIPATMAGYQQAAAGTLATLGDYPAARIIWDKLYLALTEDYQAADYTIPLATLCNFLQTK